MNFRLPFLSFLAGACLLTACSVVEHIPEGQQLYTGIKDISYSSDESARKSKRLKRLKAHTDSTGVITAVATAVEAIDQAFSGKGTKALSLADLKKVDHSQLTDEQRKVLKKQEKAERENLSKVKEEVAAVLAYAPNGALFGSSSIVSPFQLGLWTYNTFLDAKDGLGKWIFKSFADAPILISNVAPQTRAKVAHNVLRNYGYFRNRVDFEVLSEKNPKKAQLAYQIHTGPLFHLDSVAYVGFDAIGDSLLRRTSPQRLLHRGDAFSASKLSAEQQRIEQLMRNSGYYYYAAKHTTFQADTLEQPGFVQLRVMPHPQRSAAARRPWTMGQTHITLYNAHQEPLEGEVHHQHLHYSFSGKKPPLRTGMWLRALAHRPGQLYRLADQQATLDRLYAMGVLSSMDVNYVPRDTSVTCDTLDLHINATLSKPYDSAFEMYATLKSNDQVGPGVSYELSKLNAFRGGETVSWKIYGSYELMWGGDGIANWDNNSFELGTQLSFKLPRLYFPWDTPARLERQLLAQQRKQENALQSQLGAAWRSRPLVGSTTFALNADWRNRSRFFQLITMGASATYNWQRSPQWKHEFTPFDLSYNRILGTTAVFDSITTANPALYVSMRNFFIPSMSYTLTYTSADALQHPLWVQFSIKESGHLPASIYALAGRNWNERDKQLLGTPFAQFFKTTMELRYAHRLNARVRLATRAFAGAVWSYGNTLRAPYSEQFYVGGANSVRAFGVRTVGPGSYYAPQSQYSYIDQTGDIKLEANAELRASLFGSLHGAIFLDAGNVWLARPDALRPGAEFSLRNLSRIAVGTGLGVRYDLQYLVLRFDVGVGLHAPYDTGKSGFYNLPSFAKSLGFHFAIGYPF